MEEMPILIIATNRQHIQIITLAVRILVILLINFRIILLLKLMLRLLHGMVKEVIEMEEEQETEIGNVIGIEIEIETGTETGIEKKIGIEIGIGIEREMMGEVEMTTETRKEEVEEDQPRGSVERVEIGKEFERDRRLPRTPTLIDGSHVETDSLILTCALQMELSCLPSASSRRPMVFLTRSTAT